MLKLRVVQFIRGNTYVILTRGKCFHPHTMIICRSLELILILNAFGWPVHATQSFFSDSLIRKDQLHNVLEHEPAKQQTACQNSVVGTFRVPCTHPIQVCTCSSQAQSRPRDATMKLWRASTMNYLAIYPIWSTCLSSDTFRWAFISAVLAYSLIYINI